MNSQSDRDQQSSRLRAQPGLFLCLTLACYFCAHAALSLAFDINFTTDEVEAIMAARVLAPVYSVHQPPLFEWLLWLVTQLFGPSYFSMIVTKTVFLGGAAAFLYNAGKRVCGDGLAAAMAVLSFGLFYQVGWNLLQGSTHTSAVIFAVSATLWAFFRLLERPSFLRYVLLGIAIGLGLLAKFSFALLLLAFLATVLLVQSVRRQVSITELLGSLMLGVTISAIYWVPILNAGGFYAPLSEKMTGADKFTLIGPLKVVSSFALYSLIWLPLIGLLTWKAWGKDGLSAFRNLKAEVVFCFSLVAASFAILIVASTIFGVDNVKERHIHPFMVTLPLAVFAVLQPRLQSYRMLGITFTVVAIAIFAVRATTFAFPFEDVCGRCRERIPYDQLAAHLSTMNDVEDVLTDDIYVAANLHARLANKRVLHTLTYDGDTSDNCAIISRDELGAGLLGSKPFEASWPSLWPVATPRKTVWYVTRLTGLQGGLLCSGYVGDKIDD